MTSLESKSLPRWSLRQVATGTLAVALVALGFWLLIRFHTIVLIIFAGLIVSIAMQPVVKRLEQWGVPPVGGVILVYVVLLLAVVGLALGGIPIIANQAARITQVISEGYLSLRQELLSAANAVLHRLGTMMPPTLSATPAAAPSEEVPALDRLVTTWELVIRGLRAVLGVLAIFVVALFWTLESTRVKQAATLLLPMPRREPTRELLRDIETKVGRFVIGQAILSLAIGLVSFGVYLLLDLPYALLLAVFAGLMEAVPLVGPGIGAIPAIIVAVSISPATAVWVVVATVIIQQLENHILVPRVMRSTVGVRPLVTLLALTGLGSLFGVLGALVAIPTAGVIQILLDRTLLDLERTGAPATENGRDHRSVLRYKTGSIVHDIRQHVREKDVAATGESDRYEDELEALALDLDHFLAAEGGREESE